jgi:hypothetical protein
MFEHLFASPPGALQEQRETARRYAQQLPGSH